jgi:hypothetical protein
MLPLLDAAVDAANKIDIEGLDKLSDLANSNSAFMGEIIGLVAVILIFGTPIIIVLAVLMHRARRQRLQNEVILKLAEKGQPVPPELFMEPERRKSDLRSGLSLIGIGIGVAVGLYVADGKDAVGFALIPFFIGLARLIAWKLEQGNKSP